jgi:hypothetical protein
LATYTAYEPQWIAEGGTTGPRTAQIYPAQLALWRTGDILTPVTTGTITTPTGGTAASFTNATGLLTPGPSLGTSPVPFQMATSSSTQTQGAVTVTAVTAASAPAQTYFCVVTYDITIATESQVSQAFIINCAAGITPDVNVASAGAPAGATTYGVYLSFMPNTFWLQHAVTALGTPTAITYPLTNSIGINKAAASISTNIVGMADCDSDAYFAGTLGATAGGSQFNSKRSLFGATQSFGPGWTNDPFALPVTKLQNGQVEMSLVQAFNPGLNYSACGVNIDATTGYFVADTTQTACAIIQDLAFGPGYRGNTGDFGARIRIKFNGSALI